MIILLRVVLVWLVWQAALLIYNVLFHPLRSYPGPLVARATVWWKTYIEVVKQESFTHVLMRLHRQYGEVVRVGPNELHFSNPSAFNDIYNPQNRWDKEKQLYTAFGEDHTSFGFRTYAEAKSRKDVLHPLFSRRSILNMQWLVWKNMNHLATVLADINSRGESADLLFAFRSLAVDTITTFCFARSAGALDAPRFRAPVVRAMDASLPTFPFFKHFPPIRKLVFSLPPWLAVRASPDTAGLTHLQVLLGEQVREAMAQHPDRQKGDTPFPTIFSRLLDPAAYRGGGPMPDARSLREEGQTMLFAGGNTVGDVLHIGWFHVLDRPDLYRRLRNEVKAIWPDLDSPPGLQALEALPLLTATIKESLRLSPAVSSPLLRVVPPSGETISGRRVSGGTVVGMSAVLVHLSPEIFDEPDAFMPERWMPAATAATHPDDAENEKKESRGLDRWLVPFSRGPRSCLGLNLAWCELYVVFATMLRRFDMELDGTTAEDMAWRDCFTPYFYRRHLHAWCRPVRD